MDNTFLFFDIECANCFNGIGKMCSLGYVVINENFEILDEDDVVMNPETEFDWYLFEPKNDCTLAYSKDYFRMQHNFESYHSEIKKLFETPFRKIFGFSVKNDIGFLQSACERYSLPEINYAAFDIRNILKKFYQKDAKLEEWCDFFNIKKDSFRLHKSVDDAKLTMLVLKEFCKKENLSLENLISKNKDSKISVEKYLEEKQKRAHAEEIIKKIKSLYEKKIKSPYSKRFLNQHFAFAFKITTENCDAALEIAEKIYKHAGILHKSLKSNGNLIFLEKNISEEKKEAYKQKNLIPIFKDDI